MATNYYIELGGGSGGGAMSITIGTFDGAVGSANGLTLDGTVLYAQSATALVPGMVNIGSQTFGGTKTFANIIDSGLTADRAVYANGSKQLTSSAVTGTELGYVSGVTSAIQTQIDAKQGTITIGSVDTASNATVLTLSAGTLSIQSAASGRAGIVTTGAQTLDGAKTFSSTVVLSAGFTATGASTLTGNADAVQFTVKANGTQTSRLTAWTNSSNTLLCAVKGTGEFYHESGGTKAAPAYQVNVGGTLAGLCADVGSLAIAFNGTRIASTSGTAFVSDVKFNIQSAGTAGSPAFWFASDGTTGLYRIGANNLGVSVSGTKLLDIASGAFKVDGTVTLGASSTTPTHVINGAVNTSGVQTGTLTNAPTAGNPAGYLTVTINGTTSYIPYWQ